MNRQVTLIIAVLLLLLTASEISLADDSSMSRLTGDSYAYFHGLGGDANLRAAREPADPRPTALVVSPVQMAGVFSGQYIGGIPVYRFPKVTVSAYRSTTFARKNLEDKLARAEETLPGVTEDSSVERLERGRAAHVPPH